MTGRSQSWPVSNTMDRWMRDMERRVGVEERRPIIRHPSDLLGPGISQYAVPIADWAQEETASNGIFVTLAAPETLPDGNGSPDPNESWIGVSYATEDGTGFQQVWVDPGGSPSYVRTWTTDVNETRAFTAWVVTGGGGGGAPTGPAGGDLTGTYPNPTIAASAVGNAELAANAVTPDKIADLPATPANTGDPTSRTYVDAQIAAIPPNPTTLPPSGPAGGDLTGSYPNPQIAADAVTAAEIADGAVGTTELADTSVTTAKINFFAVGAGQMGNNAVVNRVLAADAVTTDKILNGTITDVDVNAANKDGLAAVPSLRTLGTGAQQATAGNDTRLSNARTPTAHATTHQPGGSDPMAVDAAAATGSLRTLGAGAAQAAAGNDARFTDARTPTAHHLTHEPGGSDAMAVDAATTVGSLRTLGTGNLQAAKGDHTHNIGLGVEDEGVPLASQPISTMDFVGAGVTVTQPGPNQARVTIPGATGTDVADVQVFTANGTWTKPAGARIVRVRMVGGGGGGGGAQATTASQSASGSGGGGGTYSESSFLASALAATVAVVVGAGGTGVSNAAGNAGTASTFGSTLVTAPGGAGGAVGTAIVPPSVGVGGANGAAGTGQISVQGSRGQPPIVVGTTGNRGAPGGASGMGFGGMGGVSAGNSNGSSGESYGGGGGGAANNVSQTAKTGGDGAAGVVIVESFS